MVYQPRTYRRLTSHQDLIHFQLLLKETDLDIAVPPNCHTPQLLKQLQQVLEQQRGQLEAYIEQDPSFATTLEPYQVSAGAPEIVQSMAAAAAEAGVGPMAAVAGALAQYIYHAVEGICPEIIIENGGDIYLKSNRIRNIAIFAGNSPFSNRIALEILPQQTPLAICTSSGTVGHALSFGKADAVVILGQSGALADAVATASANLVQTTADLLKAVEFASSLPGISGAVAILGDQLAVKGEFTLKPLSGPVG